jgi:hypothetical protein
MELSSEDSLRLNVLLANKPQAIRINESSMTLYGLSENGEAKVQLNPTCRDDQYLRTVRELLSGHVLGSPGGYPVYLQRWTRMGQTRDENLEHLLQLGEPEAVVAVACASGLTDELARRVWWISQDPENARRMLRNPAVVNGSMGRVLALFLIEYLPFETEPEVIVQSLSLALQPGLVDESTRQSLWSKCQRKTSYYLGFLASIPDDLPEQGTPRQPVGDNYERLKELSQRGNSHAELLLKLYSAPGQLFLRTALKVLEKPANQDVVSILLDVVRDYLSAVRPEGDPDLTWDELSDEYRAAVDAGGEGSTLKELLKGTRGLEQEIEAMSLLSGLGYGVLRPILSKTDAIGSLMRKKLEPVLQPLRAMLVQLIA